LCSNFAFDKVFSKGFYFFAKNHSTMKKTMMTRMTMMTMMTMTMMTMMTMTKTMMMKNHSKMKTNNHLKKMTKNYSHCRSGFEEMIQNPSQN